MPQVLHAHQHMDCISLSPLEPKITPLTNMSYGYYIILLTSDRLRVVGSIPWGSMMSQINQSKAGLSPFFHVTYHISSKFQHSILTFNLIFHIYILSIQITLNITDDGSENQIKKKQAKWAYKKPSSCSRTIEWDLLINLNPILFSSKLALTSLFDTKF